MLQIRLKAYRSDNKNGGFIKFQSFCIIQLIMNRSHQTALTDTIKLRVACIIGDEQTVRELIQSNPSLINEPLEYGKPPLSIASGWGQRDICKFFFFVFSYLTPSHYSLLIPSRFLIDNKADVNFQDDLGWTPLHWASFTGQIETCRLLLANHADFHIENKAHQTALDFEKAKELKGFLFSVFLHYIWLFFPTYFMIYRRSWEICSKMSLFSDTATLTPSHYIIINKITFF